MRSPYDVLAAAIRAKSDMHLHQVEVTGSSGSLAQIEWRGGTVLVPVTGSVPSTGTVVWLLVDGSKMVGLT